MDKNYVEHLRSGVAAGNIAAERLLLLASLQHDDRDEIEALLARCKDTDHRRYIAAELQCFHGRPGDEPWQDLLRHCAEAGHREAQFVVSVYHEWARRTGRIPEDAPNDSFSAGWDEWRAPEWTEVISGSGIRVERSAEFAPRPLVGYLRSILGPRLEPSAVIDPDSGQAIAHPVRINQSTQWVPEMLGWVGKLFEIRLAETGQYAVSNGEVPSLLHYCPGQRYKAHLDCIGNKLAESEQGRAEGGQRTLTILLAMGNDDLTGGDTWFPRLKKGAKAAPGELLRFNNTDQDGQPLPNSLHEGQAVTSGQKWLLSKWVRANSTPYGREICLQSNAS